ncbi:MAG: plasmid pRiA4b ORF-3 family protein [Pseudomonadota bacterium]
MNIYSIKVALRGISPMIWRRLRLAGTTSLADLHRIIQIAMGWNDDHLHHFHIHGVDYGISKPGGIAFRHNAEQVILDDFEFDVGDRFTYTYNYTDWWLCDVRIEAINTQKEAVPRCFGGSGRKGVRNYYKMDEVIAGAEVLQRVARAGEHVTVGEVRDWFVQYEAVRFSRLGINQQLKASFLVRRN